MYNIIDTCWFPYVYICILVLLLANKKRLMGFIFSLLMILIISWSITGCMFSVGAITSLLIPQCITIIISYLDCHS